MILEMVDAWTLGHLWFGVAAARIGLGVWPWLTVMFAWEWLEAAGLGPLGSDPSVLNSVVDVVAGLAGFVVIRYAPVHWRSRGDA